MADLSIPVTKSKGVVVINTDNIPQAVYEEALLQGLKVLVNRGMSKITKSNHPDATELASEAQLQAEKNVTAILEGKIKFSGGAKVKKASGAVMTEAMRLARNLIKDAMKREGIKISHVKASEITSAAKAYLEQDATLIETAKANLEARENIQVGDKISLKDLIKEDPTLVAKAEKAKAEKKSQLSAKQAGMPKKSKPKATAQANA